MHINFYHECPLRLNETILSSADSDIRDLGLKVSSGLGWNTHCSQTSAKAFRIVNCILCVL